MNIHLPFVSNNPPIPNRMDENQYSHLGGTEVGSTEPAFSTIYLSIEHDDILTEEDEASWISSLVSSPTSEGVTPLGTSELPGETESLQAR